MTPSMHSTNTGTGQRLTPELRLSIREGMLHAVMLGFGESYLGAFAVFLHGTSMEIGILGTLPPLIGAVIGLSGLWLLEQEFHRQRIMVAFAGLQAVMWLAIAGIACSTRSSSWTIVVLVFTVIVYYGCSGLISPAWNSLIGDLVPVASRGRFFARRNRACSLVTFSGLLAAGAVLHAFEERNLVKFGYCTIFGVACAARLASALLLARHPDPHTAIDKRHQFTIVQFLAKMHESNFARFVLYIALMNFAVWTASPYFAVYMLRDLRVTYTEFTILLGAAVLSQILTLQYWGALADRFGNKKILEYCSIGVSVVPFLWLFSSHLAILLVVQVIAGFLWGGYHLATANFLFDAVTPPKRARCVAYQAIISGAFTVVGSVVGGLIAVKEHNPIPMHRWFDVPDSVFLLIFALSGLMRSIIALVFLPMFREVREVERATGKELFFWVTHVRAFASLALRPMTTLSDRGEESEPETGDKS